MAREMYGITALDPKVAATEKFIQDQKIPPDKVEDFLLSMGADPKLASLVFKYRRVQEAAKKQQSQPPTASVDQEVSNQYAQLKQQERMGQGVAGMPAPNLAAAPMQGGITGQPMPRMAGGGIVAFAKGGRPPRTYTVDAEGNVDIGSAGDLIPYEAPTRPSRTAGARAAMSRGIGALARLPFKHPFITAGLLGGAYLLSPDEEEPQKVEGATVEEVPDSGLSDEDIRLLAEADKERPAAQGVESRRGVSAPPKRKAIDISPLEKRLTEAEARLPKDESAAIDAELAREKPYLESIAARRTKIEEQEKAGTTSSEKKFWLAFAQAGFAASAKGARNLWETLSIGGVEGMKAYESIKEKEQQLRDRLQDKRFQLDDLEAQVKRGATKSGIDRLDKLRAEVTAAQVDLTKTKVAVALAEQSEAGANYRAAAAQEGADRRAREAAAGRQQLQKLENQYYADIAAAQRTTDPKLKAAYLSRAEDTRQAKVQLEQAESGFQSAQARLDQQGSVVNMDEENDRFGSNVERVN